MDLKAVNWPSIVAELKALGARVGPVLEQLLPILLSANVSHLTAQQAELWLLDVIKALVAGKPVPPLP